MRSFILVTGLLCLTSVWASDEGLVGHWRFDKAGPTVADLTGKHPATLTGGQIVTENGQSVLRLDGKTRIEVPSAPELSIRRGYSIEARVRPTDDSDGRAIVTKEGEFIFRMDWPVETNRLSFFINDGEGWEPRVSAFRLPLNVWYHLVAIFDGTQLRLWVNGLPHQNSRVGEPQPGDKPLLIGSDCGFAKGFVGDIEYVKVYNRVLTSPEVIAGTYGAGGKPVSPASAISDFDFRRGLQGWYGKEGATVTASPTGLAAVSAAPTSLMMHDNLAVDLATRDYLALPMSVDKGSRAALVYITSKGAGRMPFSTLADGRLHTYLLEPWQFPGWGGKLIGLGLAPSDVAGTRADIQYIRVSEQPQAEGEIELQSLTTEAVLPRINRTERLVLRLTNNGGPAKNLKVTLQAPPGVKLISPAAQIVPSLNWQQQHEVAWDLRASAPAATTFKVSASGADITSVDFSASATFSPELKLPKASYVPRPVPAKMGDYQIWTHYCPLWKHGTHYGWKNIEPYPERKPVLGWFNEGTPEVADWHIKWWLEHGITGVIYCWYRSDLTTPIKQNLGHAIHDGLLKARYLDMIKFGIMWENGCGAGAKDPADVLDNLMPFWLDNYFTNPSYLKVDGKPILYIWVPGNVTKHLGGSDKVRETFDKMRAMCRARGLKGLYIVGCMGGANKEALQQMAAEGWDASSAYGSSWSPPADTKSVGDFHCAPFEGFVDQQEAIWKAKREINALPDITAAMMGWDSRPWSETAFYWSDNTPQKFRDLCLRAKAAMDAKTETGLGKNTAIFCCWNEFGEGHYIEPTRGYGFSYIDTIRDVFSQSPGKHTDYAPEDIGLGPYDSWYREAKANAPAAGPSTQSAWSGNDLHSWNGMMGLKDLAVKDGVWTATSANADPALSSPGLRLRASKFTKVVVEMRVSKPSGAQLFWSTASLPKTEERSSAHVQTQADGQFHPYVFEVGQSEYWDGCVTGMRLDPTAVEGVTIEIRKIELQ